MYEKFTSLAKTHFIQHSQMGSEGKKSKEEDHEEDKSKLFEIPPLEGTPSVDITSACIYNTVNRKLGMSSGVRISERSNHVPKSEPNFSIQRFE